MAVQANSDTPAFSPCLRRDHSGSEIFAQSIVGNISCKVLQFSLILCNFLQFSGISAEIQMPVGGKEEAKVLSYAEFSSP